MRQIVFTLTFLLFLGPLVTTAQRYKGDAQDRADNGNDPNYPGDCGWNGTPPIYVCTGTNSLYVLKKPIVSQPFIGAPLSAYEILTDPVIGSTSLRIKWLEPGSYAIDVETEGCRANGGGNIWIEDVIVEQGGPPGELSPANQTLCFGQSAQPISIVDLNGEILGWSKRPQDSGSAGWEPINDTNGNRF